LETSKKTNEEIGKEVWRDWNTSLYRVSQPDTSNAGDVADWARKEYVMELLGLFSCNFCYEWFNIVQELAEHLSKKHRTKITYEPRWTGYQEYANVYNIDSRINPSSAEKEKPWCYGKPNKLCSASHPETDEDCEFLDECVKIFDCSTSSRIKEGEE